MPKPASNWSLRNGGVCIAATSCLPDACVGAQLRQPFLSAGAVESCCGGGVFDFIEPMIGGRVESAHHGRLSRGDKHRGVIARGVDQRHVVGLRDGNPLQRLDRFFDGRTGLQDIAQHNRDAETFATAGSAAERERDREPVVVHPVQQTPEHVAGAEHPAVAGVVGRGDDAFEERLVVVVIANQGGTRAGNDDLSTADGESGKSPH